MVGATLAGALASSMQPNDTYLRIGRYRQQFIDTTPVSKGKYHAETTIRSTKQRRQSNCHRHTRTTHENSLTSTPGSDSLCRLRLGASSHLCPLTRKAAVTIKRGHPSWVSS